MEVNNIPKITPKKAEESQAIKAASVRAGVNAYSAEKARDSVDVSTKGRQMFSLKEAYNKLPEKKVADVHEIKEKIDSGTHNLTSEEIVSSILRGTLFDTI